MDDFVKEFWILYIKSDELKQREMLKSLTGCDVEDKNCFLKFMTLSLFKSYIDDLIKLKTDGYYGN